MVTWYVGTKVPSMRQVLWVALPLRRESAFAPVAAPGCAKSLAWRAGAGRATAWGMLDTKTAVAAMCTISAAGAAQEDEPPPPPAARPAETVTPFFHVVGSGLFGLDAHTRDRPGFAFDGLVGIAIPKWIEIAAGPCATGRSTRRRVLVPSRSCDGSRRGRDGTRLIRDLYDLSLLSRFKGGGASGQDNQKWIRPWPRPESRFSYRKMRLAVGPLVMVTLLTPNDLVNSSQNLSARASMSVFAGLSTPLTSL